MFSSFSSLMSTSLFIHFKLCILSGAKIGSWCKKILTQWIMVLHIFILHNKILFFSISLIREKCNLKLNLLIKYIFTSRASGSGNEKRGWKKIIFKRFYRCIAGEENGTPLQCSCLENPRGGEPGGLTSMGSHRVGHDWSDLAVAASCRSPGIRVPIFWVFLPFKAQISSHKVFVFVFVLNSETILSIMIAASHMLLVN